MISDKQILEAAILGFEEQKRRLEAIIQRLKAGLHPTTVQSNFRKSGPAKATRRLSPAGRKAIAEANRKRWAAVRGKKAGPMLVVKPKRKLTAAQLKAMRGNAMKARAARRAA